MDYHFVNARFEGTDGDSSFDLRKFSRVLVRFLPVLVLALFLPLFLMFTLTPPELNFLTRADQSPQLRIWLEPSTVVVTPGNEVKFNIVAEFISERDLLPGVRFNIDSVGNMSLSSRQFSYDRAFRGKAVIGELTAIPNQEGEMFVKIPMGLVTVDSYSSPLEIITNQARMVVK